MQLVLSGHEHDYERSVLHFVDIAIWDDHLLLRAMTRDALVFDEVELTP